MDLKAKYLLETCSDPIEYLRQLRQTTEPIGGGTVYSEDGELVEYDIAVEAIKKATDAFIEKACEWLKESITNNPECNRIILKEGVITMGLLIENFRKYMEGE